MSAKDVIKSRVYESLGGTGISFSGILIIFLAACLLGLYIFMVYKLISKAAFYSKDLNITMAGIVLVVAAIMIAMQSNLIVSLGMVGALSIVRFRNAIKNPMDLLFLFWAVSTGILCGVELLLLAVVTCAAMTVLLLLLQMIPNSRATALLVLRTNEQDVDWKAVEELIGQYAGYYKEKSRNIRMNETEVILELKCSKEDELIAELRKLEKIGQISYLRHDGEMRV